MLNADFYRGFKAATLYLCVCCLLGKAVKNTILSSQKQFVFTL